MAQLSKISCPFTSCPPFSQLARDYCDWEDGRNDFLPVSCIQQANHQEYKETNHSVKNVALHFYVWYISFLQSTHLLMKWDHFLPNLEFAFAFSRHQEPLIQTCVYLVLCLFPQKLLAEAYCSSEDPCTLSDGTVQGKEQREILGGVHSPAHQQQQRGHPQDCQHIKRLCIVL